MTAYKDAPIYNHGRLVIKFLNGYTSVTKLSAYLFSTDKLRDA